MPSSTWRSGPAYRGHEDRKQVTVDAAGYRERRETALHRMADRAAAEALRYDRPVELEPMRAPERKIVHTYLSERADVETHSEGDEPDRRLVVSPAPAFGEHLTEDVSRETIEAVCARFGLSAGSDEQIRLLLAALADGARPAHDRQRAGRGAAAPRGGQPERAGGAGAGVRPRGWPTSARAPASRAWRWRLRCRARRST